MGQTSYAPSPKVVAGGLGGAVATLVLWALTTYGHINFPPDVVAAITTIFMTMISYLTPHQGETTECAPAVTTPKSQA